MIREPAGRVAYLMTHHPRVALTFVLDEIHGLEREGFGVVPIAINPADEGEADRAGFAAEIARTRYLKTTPKGQVLAALAAAGRASPAGVAAVFLAAWRSAGLDARRLVRRTFHAIEALLVWDHCRRQNARHLHGHFAQLPSTLAWLATRFGNRVEPGRWSFSITVHGPHELGDEREAWFAAKAHDAVFVVAVADYTAACIASAVAAEDRPKIVVVRCGIDLDRFPRRAPRPCGDPPVVLIVGRLVESKGSGTLLDAVAELRRRGRRIDVEVIGDGEFRAELDRRITAADLGGQVRILGQLATEQVAARLAAADVFCLPSSTEGIPVSIMEAMAIGVPVVATPVGGIPELVGESTGVLVPVGDAACLADAIEGLVTDEGERDRLITAARAAVAATYDERRTIAELAGVFRSRAGGALSRGSAASTADAGRPARG